MQYYFTGLLGNLSLTVVLAPLIGSLIAGLGGKAIGRASTYAVTILLMLISFLCAALAFYLVIVKGYSFNGPIYIWGLSGAYKFTMGFQIDQLTAVMMLTVTFISLLVFIYSVGYMEDDPGTERFFSYISFFSFSMLVLVTANNFLQLFFGWEGVGLASYLLIGFWFKKQSAASAGLKAFLYNRVGDFGFLLGIAAILNYFGTLDYVTVFAHAPTLSATTISLFPGHNWSIITMICILLFIGAIGKSAQVPLHVWLPDSMEGPTPISALIHAATMVTAGIFMVARMSPLYELSTPALSLVIIIGATGAFFLGLVALVQNDIKRVIAYSTISQLGYMVAADGASAFSAGVFHLFNHASFKALLFLAAGSVIIALHHEQDLRKMGNLKKYLPVTYICFLIGALSLAAIPPFSGFYSKDAIIQTVRYSTIPGAHYAYYCLLFGTFVTGYYIFRAFFMAFHTQEKFDPSIRSHIKEHWVMLVPLILLAIPSALFGMVLVKPFLLQIPGLLGSSVSVAPQYDTIGKLAVEVKSSFQDTLVAFREWPMWLALSGILLAWVNTIVMPKIPEVLQKRLFFLYYILKEKFGFDLFYEYVFGRGARAISSFLFHFGDLKLLDHWMVDGSGRTISKLSSFIRRMQSGYLYHYVFVMILGLIIFLFWMFFR